MCSLKGPSLLLVALLAVLAPAATNGVTSNSNAAFAGEDNPFGAFSGFGDPSSGFMRKRATFVGSYQIEKGTRAGRLAIEATIQPDWHIYSTTQPSGGPQPTRIQVAASRDFEVVGQLVLESDPIVREDEAFPGVSVEELTGDVRWTVPIRVADHADLETLNVEVTINGQACETSGLCELVSERLTDVSFAGYYESVQATGRYQDPSGHIVVLGHVEPKVVRPGNTVNLVLAAELQPDWHIYRHAETDPQIVSKPTLIVLTKTSGWSFGEPIESVKPIQKESGLPEEPVLYYHEGNVSWTIPIEIPANTPNGDYAILGAIAYQTCTPTTCDPPTAVRFEVTVAVGDQAAQERVALAFSPGTYQEVAQQAVAQAARKSAPRTAATAATQQTWGDKSLIIVLSLAFLAGLALNVMPCVLPVIGLKVMSFVQQAGGSRWEVFSLNMWFSLGLLTVFWVLAGAAALAHVGILRQFGWGQHFESVGFTVTMIGVVFAFALSFLGVWEIPIPGFVSGGTMQGAAAKEGAVGAFSKGVLSTILATPCAGPLIVPAVNWAIAQPATMTFLAFTSIGLGMAAPYLLVGAFPQLIRALPKPGAWMETFKQLMGFLLLATVVWLFTTVGEKWTTATLTLLLGIGLACWSIGRISIVASFGRKFVGWVGAGVIVVLAALLGFVVLGQKLDWEPFSRVALDNYLREGRTVLVDFTADW